MNGKLPTDVVTRAGVAGGIAAAVALVLSPGGVIVWKALSAVQQSIALVLGAFLAAGIGFLAYRRMRGSGRGWRLDAVTITVPGVGEMSLETDHRQREAGWRAFVELASRIATQPLGDRDGSLREALASLHALFGLIREALKSMPPDEPEVSGGAIGIHGYLLAILNHVLRPCLARWHTRLKAWEDAGRDEADWPLAGACRNDLEQTRRKVVEHAARLGEALNLPRARALLEAASDEGTPRLMAPDVLAELEGSVPGSPGADRAAAAWRIHVQLETRIATQPLPENAGLLREALSSLHALFGIIRDELAALPGPTPRAGARAETVEAVAFRVLNEHLRPFLARWHPRLRAWEAEHDGEADWPDAARCRAELADLARALVAESRLLVALAGR